MLVGVGLLEKGGCGLTEDTAEADLDRGCGWGDGVAFWGVMAAGHPPQLFPMWIVCTMVRVLKKGRMDLARNLEASPWILPGTFLLLFTGLISERNAEVLHPFFIQFEECP